MDISHCKCVTTVNVITKARLYITHFFGLFHLAAIAIKACFVKTVKPSLTYNDVSVVQWLERGTCNPKVAGLNPGIGIFFLTMMLDGHAGRLSSV